MDNKIDINNLHTIAGVDLAYWKKEGKEYACCCIVAIDYESKAVVEKKYCIGEVNIPYISGCLAFREYELVERTISLLENQVELFVFDGNGYLHPRHMGLATYAGIMLNVPSIGIAKSFSKTDLNL